MEGRSHLLVALAAGVVLDSVVHLTGDPLTLAKTVPLILLVRKAVYYLAVGFGSLLPDIDNARSTLGRRFGIVSKEIQRIAGHRTLFHSLLGLALGSLLAIGAEQVVIYLLKQRSLFLPASFIAGSHLVFFGVLFGCIMHIAADALTLGGVPLLWPSHKRYGFPPNSHWRFRTGTWPEFVIVWSFIILVGIGIWQSVIFI
ncbi:MAG: metal-dependent hydrolase [Chloroflexi bacterium]|nr:metal-dependent hydrolase [Ktedonobacteraceae bacterium]MBV8821188.1 metal-dependent hydrolase [Ktedonobacteraceae bacterium]MBV9019636.1 metal-dependent hydrolase [Ktedonobacteraceae bacterium]MBV9708722.1 metal-dependent hydrolase [Chloroflexota bacterium]